MRFPGFVGPSYTLSSVDYDCQRSINLYPEFDEQRTGKDGEVAALIGTPGLTSLATIGSGPIRGIYYSNPPLNGPSIGVLVVVSGNSVYTVDQSWVATKIGQLQTSTGPVSMADNKIQMVIVDGSYGYYITLLTPTSVTQITSTGFTGSNTVTYQDGYFIFVTPNSNQFYLSDLNAITFNAPAVTGRNGNADNVVGFISVNRYLWLVGDRTTEIWFDSGQVNNPFQYTSGTFAQVGCAATYSVAKIANSVAWLGKDETGTGIVFLAQGYTPQRISTHAVEFAIQQYSTISDAIGFSYEENGHLFYFLTFPTANATWVYDVVTKMWHERAYSTLGLLGRHRANCYSFAFNTTHVVGDYSTGNIYNMSSSVYSDNGNPLVRQRITPHLSKDMNRIIYHKFQLDCEAGIGIDGTGQGTNPQAILQWSDDGGHTWSNEHWATLCPIGQTKQRTIWRRLGVGRNRVFRLTITDPVKVFIMGAEIELEECAS